MPRKIAVALRLYDYKGYNKPGKLLKKWKVTQDLESIIAEWKKIHQGECYLFLRTSNGVEPMGLFDVQKNIIVRYFGQGIFERKAFGPFRLKKAIERQLQED